MNLELSAKHVLITGASKGIGLACARGFLAEGAKVTLVARDAQRLAAAQHALQAEFPGASVNVQAADLKSPEQALQAIDRAQEQLGPIDILVNSAGAAQRTPPDELTPKHWHDAMDAKYFTYIHVLDPVVKRMAARGQGVIVNVIGMGGKIAGSAHLAGGAANAALMLVTAGLAYTYGPQGVRVNAVNPTSTLTDRLQQGIDTEARMTGASTADVLKNMTAKMPLRRLATPEEVADTVVYLASARASYLSGVILSMDGAQSPIVV
jgi:NAD(P)-dependent dehydrogenase (short-subunit alcohol dehydrogenase family)